MTKKQRALEVIQRLKDEYPDAGCTLDYEQAWKLLVSVRLAAQCTDARVNVVVEDLYAKYPDVEALAKAEPEEIEAIVKPCGLGKSKARDISACMRILHEQYEDNIPTTFEELLKLPCLIIIQGASRIGIFVFQSLNYFQSPLFFCHKSSSFLQRSDILDCTEIRRHTNLMNITANCRIPLIKD